MSSLANRAEDLQIPLSLAEPPLIKAGKEYVFFDLPRPEPKPCFLKKARAGDFACALKSTIAFPVGIAVEGDLVVADFADPNTCQADPRKCRQFSAVEIHTSQNLTALRA